MSFRQDPHYDQYGDIYDLKRRGASDSVKHNKRLKEAVKKQLKSLIAEENIITKQGSKTVKVPIKLLQQPKFRFGRPSSGAGAGNQDGEVGDVIGRTPEKGSGRGQGGNEKGEEIYEVEVEMDELIELMLEDLALPFLKRKDYAYQETKDYEFSDVRRKGVVIDWKQTIKRNLMRNARNGSPEIGNWQEDDILKRSWKEKSVPQSNAVVYLMMDNSGSMSDGHKYIVRSFFFWMTAFLRRKYAWVEIKFINHDSEAHFVDEKSFFTRVSSGGTMASCAYKLAKEDVEKNYPPDKWNVYVFHFSDGDNWPEDNDACIKSVKDLLPLCSMVGYGEVKYSESSFYGRYGGSPWTADWSTLIQEFSNNIEADNFLAVQIENKSAVYDALKAFLSIK